MSIKNINVSITIETESNERAKIICAAIDPDNLTKPPMLFNFINNDKNLKINIENVKSVETMLATLMDLFAAFQTTENVLKLHDGQ